MTATIRMAISIQKPLFDQTESLIQQFNISRSDLVCMAIEHFVKDYQDQRLFDEISKASAQQENFSDASQVDKGRKAVSQGDIFWVPLEETSYTHPHVVIQDDVINCSRINTVVVCALSTNMKRAKAPGNVLLEVGEADLPKQSVVVVSQVSSVSKTQLGEYIGSLSKQRINQILAGMRFLQLITNSREIVGEEEPV